MSSCVAAGCTKCEPQTLSSEAAACKARIATFRSVVGFDDVQMLRDGRNIVEQALSLTNNQERIAVLREFVDEFYKIDIGKCTDREATNMLYVHYRISEHLAYGLQRAGCSKEEAWQALLTGIEKYRQICFSFGDENDFSDGRGPKASERRIFALGGAESVERLSPVLSGSYH